MLNLSLKTIENNKYKLNTDIIENFVYQNYYNKKLKMDGLELLKNLPKNLTKAIFFDPQYRGILDKQNYGNEGKSKEKRRCELTQMTEETIQKFFYAIDKTLCPSGYLFLWIDKFHLCEGTSHWFKDTNLKVVDMMVWEKHNIGMGYRTRNKCEFLLILQKLPIKAKSTWKLHNIPNVWKEKVDTKLHPHSKPINLQKILIESVTDEGDVVIDPAMGSGSVMQACIESKRVFIGSDING